MRRDGHAGGKEGEQVELGARRALGGGEGCAWQEPWVRRRRKLRRGGCHESPLGDGSSCSLHNLTEFPGASVYLHPDPLT